LKSIISFIYFTLLIPLVIMSPAYAQPESGMTLTPDEFASGWTEAWNSHDADKILNYYTEDAFYEDIPNVENGWDVPLRGHQMIREAVDSTFKDMPDLEFELVSVSGAGDRMVIEWTMTGSRYRTFTGRFKTRAVSIVKLKDNKIAWERDYYDVYKSILQLGILPSRDTEQLNTNKDAREKNKQIVREVYEKAINAHNVEFLNSILADNYTRHSQSSPPGMQEITDKGTFLKFVKMHFNAFPDWNEKIEFMVAEDDKVAFLTIGTGTNTGKMGEITPTGKSVNIQNLIVHRIDGNNQIAETWVLWDNVAFLSQLGLYPPSKKSD
jgi:steroid delta-isomerase-like uncharacterized protein